MKLPKIKISKKPTYVKFAEDVDFFELFQKVAQDFDTCFIFESLGEEGKFARFSIMGFDPAHTVSARGKQLFIDGKSYDVANPYYALREIMPQDIIAKNYAGGLIGYLSYEAVNYFESAVNVKVHEVFDQFLFGVYTDGLILDKITGELFYFYYEKNRLAAVKKTMTKKIKKKKLAVNFLQDGLTQKEHSEIVEKVKKEIKAGNTFQCEVGFKSEYEIKGDTLQIYEKLRTVNPSPFMYYVKFKNKKIIGASPELLFSLRDLSLIHI